MAIFQPALPPSSAPELEDQYETLLDTVWRNEREQDLIRRIDNAVAVEEGRKKRRRKAK